MARNSLAGKSIGKSKSAVYFASHEDARLKKNAYNKKYHSVPSRIKYRQDLNKANRKSGTYGNKDGLDKSHTKKNKLVSEKFSLNRARNGKGNNPKKK
jgi:hypothetical protein